MACRIISEQKRLGVAYKLAQLLKQSIVQFTKLSDEQMQYINFYNARSTFLDACPGSGKTEVIGIRAAKTMAHWSCQHQGLAVLTFTNSAADELVNRIRKYSDNRADLFPHFVGTLDSWLHGYVFQPFGHCIAKYDGKEGDCSFRLLEDDADAGFLSNYTHTVWKDGNRSDVRATEFTFSLSTNALAPISKNAKAVFGRGLSEQDINGFKEKKRAFFKAGFATYADAEMLSEWLLTRNDLLAKKLAERFPVIVIDECQDLSKIQLSILERLRSFGTTLHFVGDLNQAIYEFRDVDPNDVLHYIESIDCHRLRLTHNFRSCQPIVDVSSALIRLGHAVRARIVQTADAPCLLWEYDDNSFTQLPARFQQAVQAHGLQLERAAILARGTTTLEALKDQSKRLDFDKVELFALGLFHWHRPGRTSLDLQLALRYTGRFFCLLAYGGRGRSMNQFCPDAIDAIAWRLLLSHILEMGEHLYPYLNNGVDATWRQWVPQLKDFISSVWADITAATVLFDDAKAKLRSPSRQATFLVKSIISKERAQNPFRTTTIHSVKGETLDAVLLVSHRNKQSPGGHYEHWCKDGTHEEEHIRFAYVAFSRPKHLLVVAIPKSKREDYSYLERIGFSFSP